MRRRCIGCAVGAEHELGREPERWPDGSPVVRLELSPPTAAPAPERPRTALPVATAPLGAPKPPAAPKARVVRREAAARGAIYEWRGRPMGLFELARAPEVRALGLTWKIIWNRIHQSGWDIERAATTPLERRGGHNRHTFAFRGSAATLSDLLDTPEARSSGVGRTTLRYRLVDLGWPAERAISQPVRESMRRDRKGCA
jgi:hypothetical protein